LFIDAIERDLLGFVGYTAVEEKSMNDTMTLSQRADALEERMSRELDYIVIKSRLYSMAEGDMSPAPNAGALMAKHPNARVLMGDDPRLPPMPGKADPHRFLQVPLRARRASAAKRQTRG